MTKSISWCILISTAALFLICTVSNPDLISDKNEFMRHFVGSELLSLLGIIMTITLASAAGLHLEFNKIEERHKGRFLIETRRGVKQGAYCLIVLFAVSVVLVVVKPLVHESAHIEALINGAVIFIVIWNVLILLELTQLAFSIQPDFKGD
jgi:hypothetical protein